MGRWTVPGAKGFVIWHHFISARDTILELLLKGPIMIWVLIFIPHALSELMGAIMEPIWRRKFERMRDEIINAKE